MGSKTPFLAWEKRVVRKVQQLQDILTLEGRQPESIYSVIRIERRLGLKPDSQPVPIEGARYLERKDLRVAYDQYRLEVVVDESRSYSLDNALLLVALHVEYPDGDYRLGEDGRAHQDPINLTLRPEDQELVDFYFYSQAAAQAKIFRDLMGAEPRVWIVREGLPQQTYQIADINRFISEAERKERDLGYDKADPHSTRYAFPGQRLQLYSQTKGFGICEDPVLAQLLAMERAA